MMRNVIGASLLDRGNQRKCWSFVKINKTEHVGIPILTDTNSLHMTNQAKSKQAVCVSLHQRGW